MLEGNWDGMNGYSSRMTEDDARMGNLVGACASMGETGAHERDWGVGHQWLRSTAPGRAFPETLMTSASGSF